MRITFLIFVIFFVFNFKGVSQCAEIDSVVPICTNSGIITLSAATSGGTWSGTGIVDVVNGIFDPVVSGDGSFLITYISTGTCSDTGTTIIVVNPVPAISYSIDINQGCSPITVTFINLSSPWSLSAQWDFGDSTSATGDTASHIFNNLTLSTYCYDISLTITSANGCIGDTVIFAQICAFPYPESQFSYNVNVDSILNTAEVNFTNLTIGGDTYFWDFGGLGTSTFVNPTFIFPDATISYFVCLASSSNGCSDTICYWLDINGIVENDLVPVSVVYPNPFDDILTFEFLNTIQGEIIIYDVLGKSIAAQTFNDSKIQMSVQDLKDGIYNYFVLNVAGDVLYNGKITHLK